MESRKLAVSGKIKHYVVDNDNVVTPLIHNNRDIVTFTGNSRFKHRSRGYFESPMNDIPNFNIGKQATFFGGMLEELWMAKSMVTMVTILSLIQTSNLSLGGK